MLFSVTLSNTAHSTKSMFLVQNSSPRTPHLCIIWLFSIGTPPDTETKPPHTLVDPLLSPKQQNQLPLQTPSRTPRLPQNESNAPSQLAVSQSPFHSSSLSIPSFLLRQQRATPLCLNQSLKPASTGWMALTQSAIYNPANPANPANNPAV